MESDVGIIVGTCWSMCPEGEMRAREATGRLHFLERLPTTKTKGRPRVSPDHAVKEFSRPAAGKEAVQASDLRPADVLRKTVRYLLSSVVSRTDLPWSEVYGFVFDRLRSVRQDMVIQRIHGDDAICILEMNVRFLVYSGYRMCTESPNVFDAHINDTHLQECLKRLIVLYTSSDSRNLHVAEFFAVYLVLNLGSAESLSLGVQTKHLYGSDPVFKIALELCLAWFNQNYVRTFRLVQRLPMLHLWAINRHLHSIRCVTLQVMNSAFASRNLSYPLSSLTRLLLHDSESETEELCRSSGLNVDDNGNVCFSRAKFHPSKQSPFHCKWIDRRFQEDDLSQLLEGQLSNRDIGNFLPS